MVGAAVVTATSVAIRGRLAAEREMTSACTIAPRGTTPTTDPDTGEVTFPAGVAVYSGKCRVRPVTSRSGAALEIGGAQVFAFDYLVSVPFAVTDVQEGHRVTVTASPDPALVGVTVEVQKVDRGEHITARRLSCNEVS
jgi:hypothetical protein